MWGNEQRTGKEILKAGTELYHTSSKKLNYFNSYDFPESTCFYRDMRGNSEYHCYRITLLIDKTVGCYGSEEVRFNPTKSNCKVEYVGVGYSQIETPVEISIVDC
jgi:hypothetical protein